VFKLTESNYRPWKGVEERKPDAYGKQMELFNDPLVESWNGIDVIYEVALKEGFSLTIDIQKIPAGKCIVYKVVDEEKFFYITLDDEVRLEDVKKLNLRKDDLFVCRDVAIGDEEAANLALQCRFKTI
jgi:adenine-specific DNA-methyltransferase